MPHVLLGTTLSLVGESWTRCRDLQVHAFLEKAISATNSFRDSRTRYTRLSIKRHEVKITELSKPNTGWNMQGQATIPATPPCTVLLVFLTDRLTRHTPWCVYPSVGFLWLVVCVPGLQESYFIVAPLNLPTSTQPLQLRGIYVPAEEYMW